MTLMTYLGTPGSPAAVEVDNYDLAFIGAGASTSYVLLALLAEATARAPGQPLRIGVIEKNADAFSGLAYGSRTARTCLLITKLRDFLPDVERRLFTTWLAERKATAFTPYLEAGGPYSSRWWDRHRDEVARDDYDDLFLPRYLFGRYLTERVQHAIALAEAAEAAVVDVVQDEVLSVAAIPGGYRLNCRSVALAAGRLVLAIGSAPVLPRLAGEEAGSNPVLVDAPLDDLESALARIRLGVERTPSDRAPVIVLIGANASTMDLLYQVNDIGTRAVERALFVVLSPRGELPERMNEANPASRFVPACLRALGGAEVVDAGAVYLAAVADIARGRAAGVPVGDMLLPVSAAVQGLVKRLALGAAAEFAGRWGAELGRHLRRAGDEYCEVVEQLRAEDRLQVTAGSFVSISPAEDDTATISFKRDGQLRELDQRADVVINCGGPERELRQAQRFLPARLVTDRVCKLTPLGGGVAVDASLAAAPGLYVMGPLLAGNIVDGSAVWHMEHCGRISAYGCALGRRLADELFRDGTQGRH